MNKNRVFSWLMAMVLGIGMLLTPLTVDAAPQSGECKVNRRAEN